MLINSFSKAKKISSWTVFIIAIIVYYFSVERTGSLWDVGEFILGAHKLEVVHPPGAPLFMLVGRMFAWLADLFSDNPEHIAFAVNMISALCTAIGAFLIARITMMLGKFALVGRESETSSEQNTTLTIAGIAAGLSTAFCSSIWFSAVEGEVYAMSTFFTILTMWSAIKWYLLPDTPKADKWLVFTAYSAGLSIGVHLLSLLTWPAIAMLIYNKKFKKHNLLGYVASFAAGAAIVPFVQKFIIVGIPTLWEKLEVTMVNDMGLPFHSGLIAALGIVGLLFFFLLRLTHRRGMANVQLFVMGALMISIGFSTIGVIVIRANSDTPINMNVPSDATRLLPYINREQYGERPLLYGPHFDAKPDDYKRTDRYGRVGDKYEVVSEKLDYIYHNKDKILLPRIGHTEQARPAQHREWYKQLMGKELRGKPKFSYNLKYMFKYQMGWMYWRYFMWNFAGRQNGTQGFMPWDVSSGHWQSGIKFIDEMRLHNMDAATDTMQRHKATNSYYFLPLIFGIIGLLFHARQDKKTFMAIMALFLITGLGLIMYSNQPPNEPRERDYVLVGSFFTFCIWIGFAVLALTHLFKERFNLKSSMAPLAGGALVLLAPFIMAFENFDDHSRMGHYGSRDYASNFLNSLAPNSIIFTYGDNDTYPLWYAQEVENIRRDVRVVNLSLIAVDWYIDKLRRKVNDSPPLKLTIPSEAYRGNNRNQVFYYNPSGGDTDRPMSVYEELAFIANPQNNIKGQTIMRTKNLYIPVDFNTMQKNGLISPTDTLNRVGRIPIKLPSSRGFIMKDELAVVDVIASNFRDRPIYFAVTCKNDKLLGMNDYMQMEGLGLRIIPTKTSSIKGLSIYGSGRVDADVACDNIMNKWRWGNFNTHETFIDESYAAELQAMKIVMMRTAQEYMNRNNLQKASEMSKKFFSSFPHNNFPYDDSLIPFIEILVANGDKDDAKEHLGILAEEQMQKMIFYNSLDDEDLPSFRTQYSYTMRSIPDILKVANDIGDDAFTKEITDKLSPFDISNSLKG